MLGKSNFLYSAPTLVGLRINAYCTRLPLRDQLVPKSLDLPLPAVPSLFPLSSRMSLFLHTLDLPHPHASQDKASGGLDQARLDVSTISDL